MVDIGKKIKEQLAKQGMTIANLVKKTRLPQSTIDNIIYGRSKKRDVVAKIARILGLPLEYFIETDTDNRKFNARLYKDCFNIAYEVMAQQKIALSKNIIEDYTYDAYLYVVNEKLSDKTAIESYVRGLVFAGIKQGNLIIRR